MIPVALPALHPRDPTSSAHLINYIYVNEAIPIRSRRLPRRSPSLLGRLLLPLLGQLLLPAPHPRPLRPLPPLHPLPQRPPPLPPHRHEPHLPPPPPPPPQPYPLPTAQPAAGPN